MERWDPPKIDEIIGIRISYYKWNPDRLIGGDFDSVYYTIRFDTETSARRRKVINDILQTIAKSGLLEEGGWDIGRRSCDYLNYIGLLTEDGEYDIRYTDLHGHEVLKRVYNDLFKTIKYLKFDAILEETKKPQCNTDG